MAVYLIPVVLGGIVGDVPGLGGFRKGVEERVFYTVGEAVNARKPMLPPSSIVYIDSTL